MSSKKGSPKTVTIPNSRVGLNSLGGRGAFHKESSKNVTTLGTMPFPFSERFRRSQREGQTPMLAGPLLYSLNADPKQDNPEEEPTTRIVDATCPDNFVQACIMLTERQSDGEVNDHHHKFITEESNA